MSEPREEAIHIAAQCWCDPENAKTVMDVDLAKSFANRLELEMQKFDLQTRKLDRAIEAMRALAQSRSVMRRHSIGSDYEILRRALKEIEGME